MTEQKPSLFKKYEDKPKKSHKSKKRNDEDDHGTDDKDPFTGARSAADPMTRRFKKLNLLPNHEDKPLYVCPDGHIFLETFSKFYKPAYDFTIAIAEPVSRPKFIQEYQINTFSLFTAVSIGLNENEIIRVLKLLSKCEIDEKLIKLISETVKTAGKLKLILKNKRYFVQSTELALLQKVANKMKDFRVETRNPDDIYDPDTGFILPQDDDFISVDIAGIGSSNVYGSNQRYLDELDMTEQERSEIFTQEITVSRFEIKEEYVTKARDVALKMNLPLSDEYDFRSDITSSDIDLDLKQATAIRPYQEKALSKMFGGGRAKSGIIVLPCGAGKTLVGITAACTVRKSTIVFCDTNYPVQQWYDQFTRWTTINDQQLHRFTAEYKTDIPTDQSQPIVLITTYSIFSSGVGERSKEIQRQVCSREWGLMVMDEVQTMVAKSFREVVTKIKAHCKLGLTATLVREDNRIIDLNYLIGPRLYEANWIDLSNQGYIARVKCYEIWCKMTGEFMKDYVKNTQHVPQQRVLSSMNPNKFNTVERLITFHEERGDKILVFADILFVLDSYAERLSRSADGKRIRPILKGAATNEERARIFSKFKTTDKVNTIFISKIGDKAIDLPDANVLIQICSHFGARMQEAQRLGRILRKKPGRIDEYNAFFYTIISEDTKEVYFSRKRQQFLIDQGYAYENVQNPDEKWPIKTPLMYASIDKQLELLEECRRAGDKAGEIENIDADSKKGKKDKD